MRLCVTVYAAMLLCNVAPGSFKQMYEQLYDWGDAHFLTLDHPSFASVFAPDPSSHMCLHSIVELFLKEDAEKIYIYAKIINNITILHWFLKILFHHPSIQDFHHIFRFLPDRSGCTLSWRSSFKNAFFAPFSHNHNFSPNSYSYFWILSLLNERLYFWIYIHPVQPCARGNWTNGCYQYDS